jgi:hypothetical protein
MTSTLIQAVFGALFGLAAGLLAFKLTVYVQKTGLVPRSLTAFIATWFYVSSLAIGLLAPLIMFLAEPMFSYIVSEPANYSYIFGFVFSQEVVFCDIFHVLCGRGHLFMEMGTIDAVACMFAVGRIVCTSYIMISGKTSPDKWSALKMEAGLIESDGKLYSRIALLLFMSSFIIAAISADAYKHSLLFAKTISALPMVMTTVLTGMFALGVWALAELGMLILWRSTR